MSDRLTNEDLDAIEARANAATEGPWAADRLEGNLDSLYSRVAEVGMWLEADAEFIAHARADVPALVAEVRRLRAAEERVRALHRVFGVYDECECDDPELDGLHAEVEEVGLTCNRLYSICEECCTDAGYQREECANYHDHSADEVYHCPTIRALEADDDE